MGVTHIAYGESISSQNVSGASLTEVFTLEMDDCEAGDYWVEISYKLSSNSTSATYRAQHQVQLNDSTNITAGYSIAKSFDYDNNDDENTSHYYARKVAFSAGSNYIDVDICNAIAFGTTYIEEIRCSVWKP